MPCMQQPLLLEHQGPALGQAHIYSCAMVGTFQENPSSSTLELFSSASQVNKKSMRGGESLLLLLWVLHHHAVCLVIVGREGFPLLISGNPPVRVNSSHTCVWYSGFYNLEQFFRQLFQHLDRELLTYPVIGSLACPC